MLHKPSGFIFELQVGLVAMYDEKERCHTAYEIDRASSVPTQHVGTVTDLSLNNLRIGATRLFDVSGTTIAQPMLVQLAPTLATATVRLAELHLTACMGLDGVDVNVSILTAAVCAVLGGGGIQLIKLGSTKVKGSIATLLTSLVDGGCGNSLEYLSLGGNSLSGPLVCGSGGSGGGIGGGGGGGSTTTDAADGIALFGAFRKLKRLLLWGNQIDGQLPVGLGRAPTCRVRFFTNSNPPVPH